MVLEEREAVVERAQELELVHAELKEVKVVLVDNTDGLRLIKQEFLLITEESMVKMEKLENEENLLHKLENFLF